MTVQADTFGSGIDTVVAVFTGTKVNTLTYRACNDGTSQGGKAIEQASVTWHAKAGTRYGIQVGGFQNQTGPIELHLKRVTPARNDDFGSSKVITTLPASLDAANRDATNQIGEPASECGGDIGLDQTRWYQFTPSTADDLQAEATAGPGAPGYVAIWTGSSLATLVKVDCSRGSADVHADARDDLSIPGRHGRWSLRPDAVRPLPRAVGRRPRLRGPALLTRNESRARSRVGRLPAGLLLRPRWTRLKLAARAVRRARPPASGRCRHRCARRICSSAAAGAAS